MGTIEGLLNSKYSVQLNHYTDFGKRVEYKWPPRVRWTVTIAAIIVHAVFLVQLMLVFFAWRGGVSMVRERSPESRIVAIGADDLRKLVLPPVAGGQPSQTPLPNPAGTPPKN